MLLRLLKMSILSSVNSILWNILLNIPLSWCWMSLLSLSYNIGLFSAVNIVTVCNSSHSARGLAASVELSKYNCIYSYVFLQIQYNNIYIHCNTCMSSDNIRCLSKYVPFSFKFCFNDPMFYLVLMAQIQAIIIYEVHQVLT